MVKYVLAVIFFRAALPTEGHMANGSEEDTSLIQTKKMTPAAPQASNAPYHDLGGGTCKNTQEQHGSMSPLAHRRRYNSCMQKCTDSRFRPDPEQPPYATTAECTKDCNPAGSDVPNYNYGAAAGSSRKKKPEFCMKECLAWGKKEQNGGSPFPLMAFDDRFDCQCYFHRYTTNTEYVTTHLQNDMWPYTCFVCDNGCLATPTDAPTTAPATTTTTTPTTGKDPQCKGGCFNAKGVLNPAKSCGKSNCDGCCECTGECPPTEPPVELKCDDSCYTKKGNLNPSKQCSKDKCNNCCECTGECQDWDDLEDDEKGNEIDDEHRPEYECAKWCYSKKHKAKSWEKKCTWFACSTCPECPKEDEKCSDKCYYEKSGKLRKEKCSTSECEGCAECDIETPECDARCYNEKNGKMKLGRCDQRICAACPECDEEQNSREPECDKDACWNAKNGKFKTHKCGDMQCAACSECDQEDASKPLKCDDSCFKQRDGSLKPNICTKNKCAGCSGCS